MGTIVLHGTPNEQFLRIVSIATLRAEMRNNSLLLRLLTRETGDLGAMLAELTQ